MTVRSKRLLLMPRAMSAGLVTHDSPSMILPSPSVTVIFSVCELLRQRLVARPMQSAVERTAGLLRDFLVVLGLEFLAGARQRLIGVDPQPTHKILTLWSMKAGTGSSMRGRPLSSPPFFFSFLGFAALGAFSSTFFSAETARSLTPSTTWFTVSLTASAMFAVFSAAGSDECCIYATMYESILLACDSSRVD